MTFVASKKNPAQFSFDKADRLPTDIEQASLHRLGDRIEPEFSSQFQMAVNAAESEINTTELQRAVETQDLQRAEDAVGFPGFEAGLIALSAGYLDSVRSGSENAKRFLPPKIKKQFIFDPMTPAVTDFIRDKSAELVTLVSDETREALKNSLLAAQRQGIHPRQAAIQIREMIGLTQRQTTALAGLRGRLIAEGVSQDKIANQIKRQSAKFLRQRGDNISRTETTRALNASRSLVWEQAQEKGLIDPIAVREWITSRDEDVCPICGPLDEQQRPIGQPFNSIEGDLDYPPAHPQCLPGNSTILASGISASSKRRFNGDLIIIRTASGNKLTCTPNHPILTRNGWIPANRLNHGGNVISAFFGDRMSASRIDNDNMPTTIEQISESFINNRGMLSVPVPPSPEDFHGDGAFSVGNGQVSIVRPDSFLTDHGMSPIFEHFLKPNFILSDIRRLFFSSYCRFAEFFKSSFLPSTSLVGGGNLVTALPCGHSAPFDFFGFAPPAQNDPALAEDTSDYRPGNAEDFRKAVDRFPGKILVDKIIDIGNHYYFGHVYNLQTKDGFYIADGIITHNCRCSQVLRPTGARARREPWERDMWPDWRIKDPERAAAIL